MNQQPEKISQPRELIIVSRLYILHLKNHITKRSSTPGIDGVTPAIFHANISREVRLIAAKMKKQNYRFSKYQQVLIPKDAESFPRKILIPTQRDKLLLQYLNVVLKWYFPEAKHSLKLRKKTTQIAHLVQTMQLPYFIKLDIEHFYESICHTLLFEKLKQRINDTFLLDLIKQAIENGTNVSNKKNSMGVPLGLPISGTLASIYLNELDNDYQQKKNIVYFRHVDDILILLKEDKINKTRKKIDEKLKKLKLKLHDINLQSEKTASGKTATGFTYLGYKFSHKNISVRESSLQKIYNEIIKIFKKYSHKTKHKTLYSKLNLRITGCYVVRQRLTKKGQVIKFYGWLSYYKNINDLTLLFQLDNFVIQCFKKYHVPLEKKKLKRFIRTYYEIKKGNKHKYIPVFQLDLKSSKSVKRIIAEIREIEEQLYEY